VYWIDAAHLQSTNDHVGDDIVTDDRLPPLASAGVLVSLVQYF